MFTHPKVNEVLIFIVNISFIKINEIIDTMCLFRYCTLQKTYTCKQETYISNMVDI